MAHTRLAVIDLLSGAQPMSVDPGPTRTDTSGPAHLVFNGEVYNHRALRKKLTRLGHRFVTDHSDTEVLLYGYRQWGSNLAKHLHGMFAFAVWDQEQRTLMLCRDRVGQKPLYVMSRDGELMFASLVSALVAGLPKGVSPAVDRQSLLTYLRLGYTFDESLVEGVTEIPPGHTLTMHPNGESTLASYWQKPPISLHSTSLGAIDALREVLTESVNTRLEADVPLGCFLSGGVDSSIIAALAQHRLKALDRPSLKTFSVAMPDLAYDESEYALAVAKHIGADHTVLQADPSDAVEDLKFLMACAGEPTADSSLLPTYWLCRAARRHVHVALSGDGGDELFGGYDRYRGMKVLDQYRRLVRLMPPELLGNAHPKSRRAKLRRLLQAGRTGRAPAMWYRSMIHLFNEPQIAELGLTGGAEIIALPLEDWPEESVAVHAAMRWDLNHYLPQEVLRKVDRASMAVALEVRSPMLDTQVADLAGHLPATVLMPGNRPKGLLRALATEMLPLNIAQRPKAGFAVPLAEWLRTSMHDALRDHLLGDSLTDLGLSLKPVRRWLDEHHSGAANHEHRLFALLQLALWSQWLRNPKSPALPTGSDA